MVAIKSGEVERFVTRPDPARPIMLVYGGDAGLVRERVQALIAASVDDPGDPFQLARLDGDELAGAPARLFDEANTIPLFGGRRAVLVRAGVRNLAPAVEALVGAALPDCRVVIEAADLRRNSPLRVVCERARNAVALPCYPDAEDVLRRLIDEEMHASGLAIAPDARAALVPLLGGDRLASRQELRKLALYAGSKSPTDKASGARPQVQLADVIAVVSDASALELDELIDAVFAGSTREVETQLAKARIAATAPGTMLSAALRHVGQLHKARLAMEEGTPLGAAVKVFAPYLHFSREDAIKAELRMWSCARLARAMSQLADAALDARRRSAMAAVIAARALLALAANARRKE